MLKDHIYVSSSSGVFSLKKNTTDTVHHYVIKDDSLFSMFTINLMTPIAVAVYGPEAEPATINTQSTG